MDDFFAIASFPLLQTAGAQIAAVMADGYLSTTMSTVGDGTYDLVNTMTTGDVTTVDMSTGDTTVGDATRDEGEGDLPAIFMCAKCHLVMGDSLSWAGSDERQNHILLRSVTSNVCVSKDPLFAGKYRKMGCVVRVLSCVGCKCQVGIMYLSTPPELDHRRSLYSMDVANMDSYVVGSTEQQRAAVSSEKMPVTMETRDSVQKQLNKVLTVALGQRLDDIEKELSKTKLTE
ncbi:protein Mis18-alpha-like isoform X2 [Engraulis encrasicolus]|uniref:protein Mis18-alpha-like isoform X2 n=1 Tax=Engraulis encrasicolus TaxID=184585 RepID=UPI002FCFCE08